MEKYQSQACGTEIHNATVTTPSTCCTKLLSLSKHSPTSSRARPPEALESMETGVQASTHAQQISTQSEAYSRNNPEQELATKPAKKAHAIPTSPRTESNQGILVNTNLEL